LGFRGVFVDVMSDDVAQNLGVPSSLYIAADGGTRRQEAAALIDRLIGLMAPAPAHTATTEGVDPVGLELGTQLQEFLRGQLQGGERVSVSDRAEPALEVTPEEATSVSCTYEMSPYNPGFWNNDPNIRSRNNCYNYASNKRTDTFAQPGRGAGSMYKTITCAEVTRAALADGLRRRYSCFPDSERPRYLVALVIAPGPGFVDFHWYRKMKEGFWAHKPGGTVVRNVDNSGRLISDPATCNRGPYTQFCGYFYTCLHQKIR